MSTKKNARPYPHSIYFFTHARPSSPSPPPPPAFHATLKVDFEFHDPAPIDYLGVRTLLAALTDGALPFDVSGLAAAVTGQTRVGSVVKTEAGGDPIALITALNTDRTPAEGGGGAAAGGERAAPGQPSPPASPATIPALAHLRAYLAGRAPSPAAAAALLAAWEGPATALLLAERLANLPPQVAPPLHQALGMEVGWATSDEPTPAGRAAYAFDRFIYVSRAFVEAGAGEAGEVEVAQGAAGKAEKGRQQAAPGAAPAPAAAAAALPSPHPPLVFARPEDEHFIASSLWAWWFRVPARTARPGDALGPVRVVVCFDRAGWAAGRAGLDAAVGNVAAGEDGE
jgi:hypothetical protein